MRTIGVNEAFDTSERYATQLDSANPLSPLRERFFTPPGDQIYLDGNSLGLLSVDAERAVLSALDQWKSLGIDGWLRANPDWFTLGERLGAMMAPLVGAEADEVVATGTTTVNLHALVSTFYRPTPRKRSIVATGLDFPSDVYAIRSQIALQGGDSENDLVLVESPDGRLIEEDDIIAAMTSDVALCLLPSVLYRSGQLLDIERLAAAGRERAIPVGFDCAHSVGAVPHRLSEWGVDFAFWCTYKYLNAGPGSIGALYVNREHFALTPPLTGWWGYDKARQFDMSHMWNGAEGAGSWQISTTNILSASALLGSLQIVDEVGIGAIRKQSLALTDYLMHLLETSGLTKYPYSFSLGTPRDSRRRGGHVAIEHEHAFQIAQMLRQRGMIPDFRPPNVIRVAPVALYTTFHEIWQTVQVLKEIVDGGAYLREPAGRTRVT